MKGYDIWKGMRDSVLNEKCPVNENYNNPPFDFAVFTQTLSSGIVSSTKLFPKYLYCLWWGSTEFEVASQFRRFHSRQVQHTFCFHSQQWRTWAVRFIQAAWRRYSKRKIMELCRKKEEEAEGSDGYRSNSGGGSYSLGGCFFASKFAANALCGIHRNQNAKSAKELVKLQKPPESGFSAEVADRY
ncbi:probable cyclic nucleotide-gated ion channel 5 [Gossypium arboreum]|uniref:probable cyclic nucleotide-gated ion channel 5 n=1 Tax=Gossypium arboreum TaxID=29729 RepID=UPI0022F172EB|nr:probable cyclic nucleotide-gated ion channel 5 [Gossypium arboreum]XP_052884658.1 probable cyclic nucleotide-gated ion channel 5 [Gossypium arboreum]